MNSRKLILGLSAILGVMLLAPAVFATVTTFSVSPSTIPTNGTVTISVCTSTKTVVQQIQVTTPNGVVWRYMGGDIPLYPNYVCPTMLNVVFGGATPNWCVGSLTPVAPDVNVKCLSPQPTGLNQTGVSGTYSAELIWKSTTRPNSEQFSVYQPFSVPEFGLPVAITAMGFVAVAFLAKYKLRPVP